MIKQKITLRNTQSCPERSRRDAIRGTNRGTALLVVLFIVMAVTILSLGFLSRSDVELACGQNMLLRTQMDYLAESGLEHAKGLIINPQDIDLDAGYWVAPEPQQLISGSRDYYDVQVVRDDNEPNDYCNYIIDCNAYRMQNGQQVGRSSLTAELRLDPCIALWTRDDTTLWLGVGINGDVRCAGTLTNQGAINGDVFGSLSGTDPNGQKYTIDKLSLSWPQIEIGDFTSYNTITQASLSGTTLDYAPWVFRRTGNLTLAGNVQVNGMLLVEGDLMVEGTNNVIVSIKNLPALYVTGDLIVEKGASLEITGLAAVDHDINIYDSTSISILGGLFISQKIVQIRTADDSSGNGNVGILYNGPIWNPTGGVIDGALEFDGVDDYVGTGKSLLNDMSEFTLAGWICENNSHKSRIGLFGQNNSIEFGFDSGWLRVWTLGDGHAGKRWLLEDFTWHHVAAVGDGNHLKIYIDGNLEDSGPSPSYYGVSPYGFNIGGRVWDASGNYFDGLIDDVRVYNRALDPNEIVSLPVDFSLIGHWKLDESGSNVTIKAAPGETAILVGPDGNQERWSQAAGAFFRSIKRKRQ